MKRVLLSLCFSLIASLPLNISNSYAGQIADIDDVSTLPDTIVVTANRNPTPLSQIGSSIFVITAAEIERSQTNMVSDLLRATPGLDVVQTGGMGRTTSVFMRGANSHHTLVIIDDVEMNDPSSPNGAYDFAHLNTTNIERIEILSGSQSVLYGSDAIGGVIRIFTKTGSGSPRVTLNSSVGAYKTFTESARLSGSTNNANFSVELSRKDTDGFSATRKDLGGIEKDGYENTEISARASLDVIQSVRLIVTGRALNATSDIDQSFVDLDDPNYVSKSKSKSVSFKIEGTNRNSSWRPSFGVQILDLESETSDEINIDDTTNSNSIFAANALKFKLETQSTFRLDSRNSIIIGAETEVEKFNSESFFQDALFTFVDTVAEVSSRTSSLYFLNQSSLTNRWFTTVGARYDNMESNDEAFTYRVTSAYLLSEIGLTLKANYGTGFKNPSLFQLFHRLYGNPELKAEESQSWEVGLQKTFGITGIEFGVTYFSTEFKNLIASDPITFLPVNIGTATSNGIELIGSVSTAKTTARFNYTYTNIKNTSDDTPILRRPKSKFSLSVGQRVSKEINIGSRILYVGERNDLLFKPFPEPAELVSLSRYVVVDVHIDYSVTQTVKLKAGIVNIFDQDYQEVLTYGVSGRAVSFGVKLKL